MSNISRKIFKWTLGILFLASSVCYLFFDLSWAKMPFYVLLILISLWNFFYGFKKADTEIAEEEEDNADDIAD